MLLCYDAYDISDLWEFFKMPVDTGVEGVNVGRCTTHTGDTEMLTIDINYAGRDINITNDLYGPIATIVYDDAAAEYVLTWVDDTLGWNTRKGQSLKALEYIALAYVHELGATGH